MIEAVLPAYGLKESETNIIAFGNGLINNTWKLESGNRTFILQRINETVFKKPEDIAHNIRLMSAHLQRNHPGYRFTTPIASITGEDMVFVKDKGFFRMFSFIEGSHTIDIVENAGQAYEAAAQFGRFTRMLSGIDIEKFRITIPGFHDLSFRYRQFTDALKNGNGQRIIQSKELINKIMQQANLVTVYENIKNDPAFRLRITHHDTKISNVLFDENNKGLCVIDLDTAMPGYFISDAGDMMRTYLSPVSEEESDVNKIEIREEFYKAIVEGYRDEMRDELTATESTHFFYAGQFIIYMQAIRFLADYLNNDIYYGAKYERHNFVRANNQLKLLDKLTQLQAAL